MNGRFYDAAGNRILWLSSMATAGFDRLARGGSRVALRYDIGQDLTAMLYGGPEYRALFWNQDGTPEAVCGNALRCLPDFLSRDRGEEVREVHVRTPSGVYCCRRRRRGEGSVQLPAEGVRSCERWSEGDWHIDVGTPHRVRWVEDLNDEATVADARCFSTAASPVSFNLVRRLSDDRCLVRCFERGVGETESCATGAVAVAMAMGFDVGDGAWRVIEFTSGQMLRARRLSPGGDLEVAGRVRSLRSVRGPSKLVLR